MSQIEGRIVAHHVGGRGFGVALNCPPRLAKDLVHILYEADEKCALEMMTENKNDNFRILPYCLGLQDRPGKLFVTKNPYASSMLKPSFEYSDYYCEVHLNGEVEGVFLQDACYDVVYGYDCRVTEVRDVVVRTLDGIIDEQDHSQRLYPDFLSLDTQGSELEILKGGERTFHEHCVALATEIEFHPMYRDQALFSGIFDFALRHGFHFAGFTYLQEISPNRLPLGARLKGFLAFGDALFLRRIDSVRSVAASPNALYLMLMKLAFIALNFGYLDYAMQVLDAADDARPDPRFRDRVIVRDCYRVLYDLQHAVRGLPPKFLYIERSELVAERKNILDRVAHQQAVSRQASLMPPAGRRTKRPSDHPGALQQKPVAVEQNIGARLWRLSRLALTDPPAAAHKVWRYVTRIVRKPSSTDSETFRSGVPNTSPAIVTASMASPELPGPATIELPPPSPATTAVENVLEQYGYIWWADLVRRRRKAAEPCVPGQMY